MATGQNAFTYTAYGEVSTFDALNGGWQLIGNGYASAAYRSDPVGNTRVINVSPGVAITTKFGAVTYNSIVEVIPTGLALPSVTRKYICDSTQASLNALRT
jgi:hypothetical protein